MSITGFFLRKTRFKKSAKDFYERVKTCKKMINNECCTFFQGEKNKSVSKKMWNILIRYFFEMSPKYLKSYDRFILSIQRVSTVFSCLGCLNHVNTIRHFSNSRSKTTIVQSCITIFLSQFCFWNLYFKSTVLVEIYHARIQNQTSLYNYFRKEKK